ncbi:type II secretion system protein GspK [Kiritimatiellota bacterium B12222]|nr:type II secretion system protein GspK [Kiritimatiellota bacterium B12222]
MNSKSGSALMLALVTIVVLSALMVSFIFRVHLESDLAARARFGMKANELSQAGQEYAKWMLIKATSAGSEPEEETGETFFIATKNLQRGVAISQYEVEMEEGSIFISISPENSRRNVNKLSDPDWEQLLENSGVPEKEQAKLISAFRDWTDDDESTRLLGAEEDDPYYQDLDLPVKNADLITLDELGMIKGFTPAILYGGSLEDFYGQDDIEVTGIVSQLTVYGDEKLNLNAASKEVLMSLSGIREEQVDNLLEGRSGDDNIWGTEDDGYRDVIQALATANLSQETENLFTTADFRWVRIISIGEVGNVRRGSLAIYEFTGSEFTLLSYEERDL